jgi:sugar lactone lactonase YvrE
MDNRLRVASLCATLSVVAALAGPAPAAAAALSGRPTAPTTIALPDGFQPEGIAIGRAPFAYLGSIATGSIYQADLRTGSGKIISTGPGTPSVGLKTDGRRLFVSGGPAGDARVIDIRTGAVLASYTFASGPSFINDVVLTDRAAWFTDSINPVLYALPLGRNGALPGPDKVVRLPLTGDLVFTPGFNANGIETTPDGKALLVVQSNTGGLFRVDTRTGVTRSVDLGGETLLNGDGLLRDGRTLYAVQNQQNTVAVLRLDNAGTTATVRARLTDPRLDLPTTVAAFGNRLYLPNARFNTPPGPTVPYAVIGIAAARG